MERVTALLLALGAFAPFGVSWQFVAIAALVEVMRVGPRAGSFTPPLGGVLLGFFVTIRIYASDAPTATDWVVGLLAMLSYVVAFTLGSGGWERCRLAVLAIVVGSTAHGLLNLGLIVSKFGLAPSTRLFDDVWTGSVWVATGQATLWVPVVGALPYLLFGRAKRASFIVGCFMLGTALLAAAILASRTLVGLVLFSLAMAATLMMRGRGSTSRLPLAIAVAATAGFVACVTVPRAVIENLPLVSRLASGQARLGDDPRLERWSYYLDHMWEYPDGHHVLHQTVGYAHNMWLDSFDADGAIPFVVLVLFTVAVVVSLIRVARRLPAKDGEVLLLLGVVLTWMLQASTEPLIDLAPYLFAAGCGFAGAAAGLAVHLSEERVTQPASPRGGQPHLASGGSG